MGERLTKARRRVLKDLVRLGGKATPNELGYPRADMMHALFIAGLVAIEGRTNAWGEPAATGFWTATETGRAALGAKP